MNERPAIRVVAIVPLSGEYGGDELLVMRRGDALVLPCAPLQIGERLMDAAARVVLERAGFVPDPVRLVYLLEQQNGSIIVGVQCTLPADIGEGAELRGEFVSLTKSDLRFEPVALREILVEDLRSGFVRPVAHLVESSGGDGPAVQITW